MTDSPVGVERKRRDRLKGLGHTQVLVLHLLADEAKSIRNLAYDWPDLTESAARGAVERLGLRGLVDAAGRDDYDRQTFRLTGRGREVERRLVAGERP